MLGGISIQKCSHGTGWVLVAGNDASDFCSFNLDTKTVGELIEEINKAACDGAPWTVYEESLR